MAQEPKNTTFEVMFDTPQMLIYRVTAAYTDTSSALPGWVLLKTEDGVTAAQVRADRVLMLRRADADPLRVTDPSSAPLPERSTV